MSVMTDRWCRTCCRLSPQHMTHHCRQCRPPVMGRLWRASRVYSSSRAVSSNHDYVTNVQYSPQLFRHWLHHDRLAGDYTPEDCKSIAVTRLLHNEVDVLASQRHHSSQSIAGGTHARQELHCSRTENTLSLRELSTKRQRHRQFCFSHKTNYVRARCF